MDVFDRTPQIVCKVPLPDIKGRSPGPLQTVLQDEDGTIYCTDEINHCIFAVTECGELLWEKGGHGSEPGRFWYPRGLALGWIKNGESLISCLAIADSWNHRVQLVDLSGNLIRQWQAFNGRPFGEVSDVRFIPQFPGRNVDDGWWLILDRGNQRLCIMGTDGSMAMEVGRSLGQKLEPHWAGKLLKSIMPVFSPEFTDVPLRFDPLNYPSRILGRSPTRIFLWEPGSRQLKQVVSGSLLVVGLGPPHQGEWLSADDAGLLSWSSRSGLLSLYDSLGNVHFEVEVEGELLASNLPSNEIWLRIGSNLHRLKWDVPRPILSAHAYSLAAQSVARELTHLVIHPHLRDLTKNVLDIATLLLTNASKALSLADESGAAEQDLELLRTQLNQSRLGSPSASEQSQASREFLSMPVIKCVLITQASACQDHDKLLRDSREIWHGLVVPIEATFLRLLACMDAIALRRIAWESEPVNGSGSKQPLTGLFSQLEMDLLAMTQELYGWFLGPYGLLSRFQGFISGASATAFQEADTAEISRSFRVTGNGARRKVQTFLREVARIRVADPQSGAALNPFGIATTDEGHIFVSIFSANRISHLDAAGNILESIGEGRLKGPVGIVFDPENRLWIVECNGHCVSIYDPAMGEFTASFEAGGGVRPLHNPMDICRGPGDWMLVADSANARIIRISPAGIMESHCEQSVAGFGGFRHPLALCPDMTPGGGTWVVDDRRHDIVLLDSEGGFVRRIGCGIGRGMLVMPQSLSIFKDGVLVVLQNQLDHTLRLFTPEAEEFCRIPLDYTPGSVLIQGERLLVTEWEGIHIRTYERD